MTIAIIKKTKWNTKYRTRLQFELIIYAKLFNLLLFQNALFGLPFIATVLIFAYKRGFYKFSQVNWLKITPAHGTVQDKMFNNVSDSPEKHTLHQPTTGIYPHSTTISSNESEALSTRLTTIPTMTTKRMKIIDHLPMRLVYIKTRKTGSSTMTNILYRFALRHNLSVMTFLHNYPKVGNQFPMHELNFMVDQPKPSFNLIMEHLYYDEDYFSNLMPGKKIFISTLRNPFEQLMSDVHYQKGKTKKRKLKSLIRKYKRFNMLNSYTLTEKMHPVAEEDILANILNSPEKLNRYGQRYLKMPQFFSGNKLNDTEVVSMENNKRNIHEYLQEMSSKFELVLITEYYDASLVLLKRKLSWELQDIIYSPLKRGRYTKKHGDNLDNLQLKHQQLKPTEYALYQHFNQTFWGFLSRQPTDFWEEVEHYKNVKDQVLRFCGKSYKILQKDAARVETLIKQSDSLLIKNTRWNKPFRLDFLDCVLMKTHKDTFVNINTIKNFPRLCQKLTFPSRTSPQKRTRVGVRKFITLRNYPLFNSRHCSPVSTRYHLPLDVFTMQDAYDWDDYFRKSKKHHKQ